MALPPNYHRDWQRKKALEDPEWYEIRKQRRTKLRQENKAKAVQYKGSICARCGQTFPDCCYDFHHIDVKANNEVPSSVLHRSWKSITTELDKCIMVCANCHRIIHNEDGYKAHEKRK